MIDRDVILRKINGMQNCLQRIHDKTNGHADKIDDPDIQDITILNLLRCIQLCIDICAHIITEKKLGLPKTLKDSFLLLHQNNILNKELTEKMCNMVGFRNIAYHDYQVLSIDILKIIIEKHLGDFEEFYTIILNYLEPTTFTAT